MSPSVSLPFPQHLYHLVPLLLPTLLLLFPLYCIFQKKELYPSEFLLMNMYLVSECAFCSHLMLTWLHEHHPTICPSFLLFITVKNKILMHFKIDTQCKGCKKNGRKKKKSVKISGLKSRCFLLYLNTWIITAFLSTIFHCKLEIWLCVK